MLIAPPPTTATRIARAALRVRGAVVLALVVAACAAGIALAQRGASPVNRLTTVDGASIELGTGVTELVFGARWAHCETDISSVRRRMSELSRLGYRVVLVGVGTRQTRDEFVGWARRSGYEGPLAFDESGQLEKAFGARVLPWFVVVERGTIVHQGERPPATAEARAWLGSAG